MHIHVRSGRHTMFTPRSFAAFLTLATTLSVVNISPAAAADPVDHMLQQQRELLAGRPATSLETPRTQRDRPMGIASSDVQENLKRVLLGTSTQGGAHGTHGADVGRR